MCSLNSAMKKDDPKIRYCVQHENHARVVFSALCSLMEHQSLVDLAIRCGNNTIHAHKCILAANSPYFREQLEKNVFTEQVVVTGIDFSVMKAVVEFMYCGETQILEDHLKQLAAVAKLFQIRGLPGVAPDHIEADNASFLIPPPIFLSKKPKYSSTYGYIPYATPPNNTTNTDTTTPIMSNTSPSITNSPSTSSSCSINQQQPQTILVEQVDNYQIDALGFNRRMKRKSLRNEAEKACAKEATASRLALEAIQKELGTATAGFVLDNREQQSSSNYNLIGQQSAIVEGDKVGKLASPESAAEKIKHMFGQELPSNVEIMFKTSDGNFVNVTDEMLQAITKEALQFQVIDENGQASEIQFLKHDDKPPKITTPTHQLLPTTLLQQQNHLQLHQIQPSSTCGLNHEDGPFVFLNTQQQTSGDLKQQQDQIIKSAVSNHLLNMNNSSLDHPDLYTNLELLGKAVLQANSKKNDSLSEASDVRDVMFVEGIGNVVCSETVRKEDDVFFEVNPRYYGGGDNYHTSPKRKISKSNCEIQDMVISPKKPAEKSFPNMSLISTFEGDNIGENTDVKPINNPI